MAGIPPSVCHPNARAVDWAARVFILPFSPLLMISIGWRALGPSDPEGAVRDNESQEPDTMASRG